jgi:hypothetical protein
MRYPCPCCGHIVHAQPPGSYLICPICYWEDDGVQLRWPDYSGGANRPSLIEAQEHYARCGANSPDEVGSVRLPSPDEPVEPGWRMIDPAQDTFEPNGQANNPWPRDTTVLYYWRRTFWLR